MGKLDIIEADGCAVRRAPGLLRLNGVGVTTGGAVRDPELNGMHLQSVWFTFLFIPVFMVGVYLASHPRRSDGTSDISSFRFHRKLTLRGLKAAYGRGLLCEVVAASAWTYLKEAAWVFGVIAVLLTIALPFVFWMQSGQGKP